MSGPSDGSQRTSHLYHVGELYSPNRTSWPEAAEYSYRGGAHEVHLFHPGVTQTEELAVGTAPMEVALLVDGLVIVLLQRFEGGDWSDMPYSWHLVPEAERTIPPPLAHSEGALLTTFLVNGSNGILRRIRVVSMPHPFAQALHAAIRAQADAAWDEAQYEQELARLQSAPAAALAHRARVRARAGAG